MRTWAKQRVIYEINTWAWLQELGQKYRKPVNLATVPEQEWDQIGSLGFDAVWFMGVWERSPAGIAISMLIEIFGRMDGDRFLAGGMTAAFARGGRKRRT